MPLPHEGVLHRIALALEQQDVPVVGQLVDYRRGHLVAGEDGSPFRKLRVRRNNEAPPFVAFGDDPEQQLREVLVDRHVAQFVQDQKLGPHDRDWRLLQGPAGVGFKQPNDQLGDGE